MKPFNFNQALISPSSVCNKRGDKIESIKREDYPSGGSYLLVKLITKQAYGDLEMNLYYTMDGVLLTNDPSEEEFWNLHMKDEEQL